MHQAVESPSTAGAKASGGKNESVSAPTVLLAKVRAGDVVDPLGDVSSELCDLRTLIEIIGETADQIEADAPKIMGAFAADRVQHAMLRIARLTWMMMGTVRGIESVVDRTCDLVNDSAVLERLT